MDFDFLIVIGVQIALAGAFVAYFERRARSDAARTANWPRTAGEVTRSRVIVERIRGDDETPAQTWHRPDVAYSYRVGGRSFAGCRIRPGGVYALSRETAEALCKTYPLGRSVEVAYDPARPELSLLQPGDTTDVVKPYAVYFLVVGVVTALVGYGLS